MYVRIYVCMYNLDGIVEAAYELAVPSGIVTTTHHISHMQRQHIVWRYKDYAVASMHTNLSLLFTQIHQQPPFSPPPAPFSVPSDDARYNATLPVEASH